MERILAAISLYTVERQMMVMFSRSDRSPLSQNVQSPLSNEMSSMPIEELAQAFTTFNAYAGTYTVNGSTVTHKIEIASIPNRVSTALARTFAVNGKTLTLRTPTTNSDGVDTSFELLWERISEESFVI